VKALSFLTLGLVGAIVAGSWAISGRFSWFGLAMIGILAAKSVLSWSHSDVDVRDAASRRVIEHSRLGVAIPMYNEDPALIERTLESILVQTRKPDSVVVVDDGSMDATAAALVAAMIPRFTDAGIELQLVREDSNHGKRRAIVTALDAQAATDILLSLDSDTVLAPDAIEHGLAPFADPAVQASTGMVLPLNYRTNLFTRLMDVRYANAFLFERSAYSRLGSVLCVCGALAFYRVSLLSKYREDFLGQTFLGKPAEFGDDRRLTNYALTEGTVRFQAHSVAYTAVPERLGHYIRQQIRWNKSYFRETLWALANLPVSRPAFWLTFIELSSWLLFSLLLAYALVMAPVLTGSILIGPYLIYTVLLAYARSARYFEVTGIRRPASDVAIGYLLAPLYGLMHLCLLIWLRFYALLTLRSGSWGTRRKVEVAVAGRPS